MTLPSPTGIDPTLPKVVLADGRHLVLDALQAMMRTEFNVMAVDNSQAFIHAVEAFEPNVAVLNVSMPGSDGFMIARKALECNPDLRLVFFHVRRFELHRSSSATRS